MGLCHGKSTTTALTCWPDLPQEIVRLILSRLPSHDDRLSFKAVCREWRLAARQQRPLLPPAAPCINLGHGTYLNIATDGHGGKVRHRFSVPRGFRAGATFGAWVLYEHKRSGRCYLRDPFSMAIPAIEIPCRYSWYGDVVEGACDPHSTGFNRPELFPLDKIIVCSSRLVVMTLSCWGVFNHPPTNFACFRPGTRTLLWSNAAGTWGDQDDHHDLHYMDIIFHLGKIFAVSATEHLFAHQLVGETLSQRRPDHVIKEPPAVPADAATTNYHHLVTSSDKQKLLMVRWSTPRHTNHNEVYHHIINLQVFEADLDNGRWLEVKDLGNQVLFIGLTGCKSLVVEGLPEHYYGHRFQGGNRVVLLGHDWPLTRRLASIASSCCLYRQKLANSIPSYCVYDMVTSKSSIVSLNGGHGSLECSQAEWFFPS